MRRALAFWRFALLCLAAAIVGSADGKPGIALLMLGGAGSAYATGVPWWRYARRSTRTAERRRAVVATLREPGAPTEHDKAHKP